MKHKVSITTPYLHVSIPPLFGKLYKSLLHEDKQPQMSGCADTSFTEYYLYQIIYLPVKKNLSNYAYFSVFFKDFAHYQLDFACCHCSAGYGLPQTS